ncbi:spiroplasma plectrovirus-related protein [Spiroplasma phoeniceum P40]|uniref:Spiroplasma plectrovirus-related protein n=1 Tax=Spiroplasma phoeniceum P40 TaxID=1276259 RepID=A0A345DR08_9MOLU|nr:spiroplasma plectrovirus-related protein [Spiroplasma phoeniceum P40]
MVFSLYKNIYKFVNLLKIRIINLKVTIKIIISEIIVLIVNTIHDNQKIDGITFVKNEFIKLFKIIYI